MAFLVTNPKHNGPRDRLLRKHSKQVFGTAMSLADLKALKKSDYAEYAKHAAAAEKIESLSDYKAAGKAFRGALKAGGGKVAAWEKDETKKSGRKGGRKGGRKTAAAAPAEVSGAEVKVVGKRVYVKGRKGAMSLDDARAAGYIKNKGAAHKRAHAANVAKFRASKGLMGRANGLVADSLDFVRGELNVRNVVTGVTVGVAHYYVAPMVSEQVAKLPYVGEFASENLSYSITGLAAGAVLVAGGEALNMRRDGIIAAALAFGSGLVLDTIGYLTRGGSMGDLAVTKNPYGDLAVVTNPYGDLAVTALPEYEGQRGLAGYGALGLVEAPQYGFEEYGDAELADAAACPDDFSSAEGQALIDGPRAMAARFPAARSGGMRRKAEGPYSRHAGQPMARWAWLIKVVGGEKARAIAALPPQERVRVIRALKQQALAAANKALSARSNDYSAVGAEGAMGAGGAEGAYGYGATVALGAGF
jgi:hypothetical protein